jgi:gluconolactonase
MRGIVTAALSIAAFAACAGSGALPRAASANMPLPEGVAASNSEPIGSVEVLDPRMLRYVDADARFEQLAVGFDWSEGPVWDRAASCLLFSDVPKNVVYRWSAQDGLEVALSPSGCQRGSSLGSEPGSNGLAIDEQGRLVLCEHGDRRVGRIERDGRHVTLIDRIGGKRFHSPNDLALHSSGAIFFTDPPYGLSGGMDDPSRELAHCGVYLLRNPSEGGGDVTLLDATLTRPNGLALSPDESVLYVAISDGSAPRIVAFDVAADLTLRGMRTFFDAKHLLREGNKGSPDGLRVARDGTLFATGPGGVLVIAADGAHLGTLRTGEATANCAFGDDGSTLYATADSRLLRIRTKTVGCGF